MTDREKFMCLVMAKISEHNLPIVFKGALISKLVLQENSFNSIDRETQDIDANWISQPPSMDYLVNIINKSLGDFQNQYYAVAVRNYGEQKSAGLVVKERASNEQLFFIDISMKPVIGSRIYYYGNMSIKGVLPNDILSDKISVLASDKIFRRVKDFVDVYALSHCVEIKTADILDACRVKGREMGSFNALYTRRADLEHAYNKLVGVKNKPDFNEIYPYITNFTKPFAEKSINKKWDINALAWVAEKEISETDDVDIKFNRQLKGAIVMSDIENVIQEAKRELETEAKIKRDDTNR
ncbi:MAG: nucleotidyl transferase AbiEii/AbiGii toxin family protein [Oscillospiraceae bacterium]|nr:nucleotidyl transferase AbiEii/AbiGii toxin family protein [Oscillospiraceae bacterium]